MIFKISKTVYKPDRRNVIWTLAKTSLSEYNKLAKLIGNFSFEQAK
jgi:hypothetical protein